MRCLLLVGVIALAAGGCHRRSTPPPSASPVRASRGFDPSLAGRPEIPTPAEREKLRRLRGPEIPSHFVDRPRPADHALAIYVDESLIKTVPAGDLAHGRSLESVLPKGAARVVLAHGESGEVWIPAAELRDYGVRLNQRGQLKLEWQLAEGGGGGSGGGGRGGGVGGGGGGGGGSGGGHHRPAGGPVPPRVRRAREVRDLEWIEVRSPKSARLAGEP